MESVGSHYKAIGGFNEQFVGIGLAALVYMGNKSLFMQIEDNLMHEFF